MLKIEIKDENRDGYKPVFVEMRGTKADQMRELATLIGLMLREYPIPLQKELFTKLITDATAIILSDGIIEKSRIDLSKLGEVINQEDGDK